MEKTKVVLKNWKLHITLLAVVVLSEQINIIKIPIGAASIMFLPLLYAMVIGLILVLLKPVKWINQESSKAAGGFVVLGISVFIAKISVNSGAAIMTIIKSGYLLPLVFQEFGNLGTILIALPVALLLGFRREAVGMTHSIAREPNVAYMAQKYGLDSPEGRGVITTYTVGTVIGTIFMNLLVSFLAAFTPLHAYALAMACGVGSGSMMAASSAPLLAMYKEGSDMYNMISSLAGLSNTFSTADGIVMTVFIGLPLCNWLYSKLYPRIGLGRKEKKLSQSAKGE
ncbi:hypothetical protein OBV_16380 [Oscillibacter valericigenes Sjm18-20]|nr:hypothetical protein OBV_16380 [Oscillibacter valericigenes Sjm18-20]